MSCFLLSSFSVHFSFPHEKRLPAIPEAFFLFDFSAAAAMPQIVKISFIFSLRVHAALLQTYVSTADSNRRSPILPEDSTVLFLRIHTVPL